MANSSINMLRGMPIFGGISESALQTILAASSSLTIDQGAYLFREGDAAESVFVLETGSVAIEKACKSKAYPLGKLGPGDCIGEMALIDFQPRSASVRAETDCQVIQIPARSLRQLLQDDLEQYAMIMMNMGREVSRRLRLADKRLLAMIEQQQNNSASNSSNSNAADH